MEIPEMIDGIQDILVAQGITEPVLLGILSRFLSKCPPLFDDIQVGGGINEDGHQFLIIEINQWQCVFVIEYPRVIGFIANSEVFVSQMLDYSPNITNSIKHKNINQVFDYFSNVALILAEAKYRYPHRKPTADEFDKISQDIGFLDL